MHRMMGQGHSIPIYNLDMPSNTISHSYVCQAIDRRRDFFGPVRLSLCLFLSLLPLSTHPLQKLLWGEKSDDGQIVFFALRSPMFSGRRRRGRGRQKRREIKTKWNVLLSPGYPFYSYHNDNPPFLTCSRADGRTVRAYFLLRLPKFH